MVVTLGQQYNGGEKPTVILYSCIHHHTAIPNNRKKQKDDNLGLQLILIQPFGGNIDCKVNNSLWDLIGFPDGSNIVSTVSCRG